MQVGKRSRESHRGDRNDAQQRCGQREPSHHPPLLPQQADESKGKDDGELDQPQTQKRPRPEVPAALEAQKSQRIHDQHHKRHLPLEHHHPSWVKQETKREVSQRVLWRRWRIGSYEVREQHPQCDVYGAPELIGLGKTQLGKWGEKKRFKRRMILHQEVGPAKEFLLEGSLFLQIIELASVSFAHGQAGGVHRVEIAIY